MSPLPPSDPPTLGEEQVKQVLQAFEQVQYLVEDLDHACGE